VASLPRPGLAPSEAGASLSLFALARASRERQLFVDDRRGLQGITLDMENTVLAEALPARVFARFQKAQAQDKAIAVGVEVPPGALVSAERDKVVRVLSNLVSNALKYSDRGGHVELRVRATAGGSSSR